MVIFERSLVTRMKVALDLLLVSD